MVLGLDVKTPLYIPLPSFTYAGSCFALGTRGFAAVGAVHGRPS